jgi:hypothetical protein
MVIDPGEPVRMTASAVIHTDGTEVATGADAEGLCKEIDPPFWRA